MNQVAICSFPSLTSPVGWVKHITEESLGEGEGNSGLVHTGYASMVKSSQVQEERSLGIIWGNLAICQTVETMSLIRLILFEGMASTKALLLARDEKCNPTTLIKKVNLLTHVAE